jgi:hypothetical protein
MAFAKLKAHLRRIGARTFDDLIKTIGSVCAMFSPDECWNCLQHAGYAPELLSGALVGHNRRDCAFRRKRKPSCRHAPDFAWSAPISARGPSKRWLSTWSSNAFTSGESPASRHQEADRRRNDTYRWGQGVLVALKAALIDADHAANLESRDSGVRRLNAAFDGALEF